MDIDLLTLSLTVLVTVALVVSRTYVAFVTLALCGGFVLREVVALDLTSQLNENLNTSLPIESIVELSLLVLPAILVAYRFIGSQSGPGRFLQQLIPSISLAFFALVLVYQSLPSAAISQLEDVSYIYGNVLPLRSILVVFALATALFDVLIQHAERPSKKK